MAETKERLKNYKYSFQKTKEKIAKYRPIDDTFFEKIAEDSEVCEELLRVILQEPELKVVEVIPQKSIKNFLNYQKEYIILNIMRRALKLCVQFQKNLDRKECNKQNKMRCWNFQVVFRVKSHAPFGCFC